MLESTRKKQHKEMTGPVLSKLASQSATPAETEKKLVADWDALIDNTPVLTGRANVLPGRSQTFYACFTFVSPGADEKAFSDWFKARKQLTFGLFDVPVQRDAAGVPTKKTSYQFTFKITEFKDTYEYRAGEGDKKGFWVPHLASTTRLR